MKKLTRILILLVTTSLFSFASPGVAAEEHKYVLVTGTSTGIGRNLVETLSRNGYHVYAGVLKNEELAELNAIENVTAVKLDVTKQDEVDAAVAMITKKRTGLYGLVNNAGVGGGGKVLETDIEDQTFVFNVNVEGVYRITKAFAPLIIESKGRIATTGSIAGTVSWPDGNAYAGSKHWIEAFTDALAGEMAPLGVSVSVIEPGNYQSHIRRSSLLRRYAKIEAAGGEISPEMKAQFAATEARELSYKQPDDVSKAYLHALFDAAPLRRYVVVPNAGEQKATISTKIDELVQLNQWGPYRYSRDELVEMLDEATAAQTDR